MKNLKSVVVTLSVVVLLSTPAFAESLVIKKANFNDQKGGISFTVLGGVGDPAKSKNVLFVTDKSYLFGALATAISSQFKKEVNYHSQDYQYRVDVVIIDKGEDFEVVSSKGVFSISIDKPEKVHHGHVAYMGELWKSIAQLCID